MKKIFFIAILLLAGCEDYNYTRESKDINGNRYFFVCIDGKEFITVHHGFSINLDMDGKPIPCKGSDEE